MDCLLILETIFGCFMLDVAMLSWTSYIVKSIEKSYVWHEGTLMWSICCCGKYMKEKKTNEGVDIDFLVSSHIYNRKLAWTMLGMFFKEEYDENGSKLGNSLELYLIIPLGQNKNNTAVWIKAYELFLCEEHVGKNFKEKTKTPFMAMWKKVEQKKLILEYHDKLWLWHKGIWMTFSKLN
mgnify:CR=1 FL=1